MRQWGNYILILVIVFSGCRKDVYSDLGIELVADVMAEKTTHFFTFSVKTDRDLTPGEKIYCRYDWEGDGIWDTPLTEDLEIHHRYYAPGQYLVKAEFLTQSKKQLVDSIELMVDQGFSAPKANFQILPESGHFMTNFVLDASVTIDDEDSLEFLRFKWDVYADNLPETGYEPSPRFEHIFPSTGKFPITLEVKDPSNRFSSITKWISVNDRDTLIIPEIQYLPEDGTAVDTFYFDASNTHHLEDDSRTFSFLWRFPNENNLFSSVDSSRVMRVFPYPGYKTIKLIVTDQHQLRNEKTLEIYVPMGNLPPTAFFETPSQYANISSQVYFRAWGSRDDAQMGSDLEKRWDFDGDGIWDTPYSKDMEMYHQYPQPGVYTPILEVKDQGSLTGTYTSSITITPYSNPTGYLVDNRDNTLYATVEIGGSWWMAENLRFTIPGKQESGLYTSRCLNEDPQWCEKVGPFYHTSSVIHDRWDSKYIQICPDGWHIPTKTDWETLIEAIGGDQHGDEMMTGGSSDFNALYLGYGDFRMEGFPTPTDTIYFFEETFQSMQFASSTIPDDINDNRTDVFSIKLIRGHSELWVGYKSNRYYLPVRCVKDN